MAGCCTHFSERELAEVLGHYQVGTVSQSYPLSAGNSGAPKMVVVSDQGKFLLKRRAKGKDDIQRVGFAHAVQNHLANAGFPVSAVLAGRQQGSTVLQLDNHVYEVFRFVEGCRYGGSAQETIDAGRQLGKFHVCLNDFQFPWQPSGTGFHDSNSVRKYLKSTPQALSGTCESRQKPDRKVLNLTETLMTLYNDCSIHVNELGFDSWQRQVVHGDWHPGNMLFSGNRIVAVVDFDSLRIAPAVTDLANGMLQFSIVGDRPNPADWPDYLDQAKLIQFLNGYREVIELQDCHLQSLPALMIETIIAEAVLPIAATGFFGHLSGVNFLEMIVRKARWIDANGEKLAQAMKA
ncbi:MAG TPA: phosphotransferase [Sedimentisphaerales bacterium]|nr:phosphotransferase [Sedimentisphaerales bacterium]